MKIYRFFKNKRYYLSGKSAKTNKWYFLNKTHQANQELYLDMEKFAKGLEVDDKLLTVKEGTDNVLVFKTAESEREYCISKEEVAKRKEQRQAQSVSPFDFIKDIIKELFMENEELIAGEHISKILEGNTKVDDTGLVKADIADEDLPF